MTHNDKTKTRSISYVFTAQRAKFLPSKKEGVNGHAESPMLRNLLLTNSVAPRFDVLSQALKVSKTRILCLVRPLTIQHRPKGSSMLLFKIHQSSWVKARVSEYKERPGYPMSSLTLWPQIFIRIKCLSQSNISVPRLMSDKLWVFKKNIWQVVNSQVRRSLINYPYKQVIGT